MKYISLFAGICGFDLALDEAGMECAAMVEIDPACQKLLRRRFPGRILYGDIKKCGKGREHELPSANVVVGGFPCQDVSIAGRREGLAGERSGLWFEFKRIIEEINPEWVVVENVPGLLSSNGGRDFAEILSGLVKLRYGVAWRILDAQYFGVPQRRRRVFIVGHLGDGCSAAVLFERDSLPGDTPPSRKAGKGVAATIRGRAKGSSNEPGRGGEDDYNLIAHALSASASASATGRLDPNGQDFIPDIAPVLRGNGVGSSRVGDSRGQDALIAGTLPADYGKSGGNGMGEMENGLIAKPLAFGKTSDHQDESQQDYIVVHETGQGFWTEGLPGLRGQPGGMPENIVAFSQVVGFSNVSDGSSARNADDLSDPLTGRHGDPGMVAWEMSHADDAVREAGDIAPTLQRRMGTGGNQVPLIGVRRLTPVECERLQGFRDGWTAGQSDSARYKQLGNAVAVPAVLWLAKRIVKVNG